MLKSAGAAMIVVSLAFASCRTMPLPIDAESGGYVKTPEASLQFWRKVMTPTVAARYRAMGRTTYCNVFVADTLKEFFGPGIYDKVLPGGLKSPGIVYHEWRRNPDLVLLDPDEYSLGQIQALADQDYVVLLAYYNDTGKSHLAFVGNSRLDLFTVPTIANLEGKAGSSLKSDWLPIVVQAGTYAGITSAAYATNGWFSSDVHPFIAELVQFYLIKS